MFEFLEVMATGCGATWQDAGRTGWKRFGVPPSGWMDDVAARAANRLLDNAEDAVVLELALQGAAFRVRRAGWLALAGAAMGWAPGTARRMTAGEVVRLARHAHGVYAYLAAPGGWVAPQLLGSASVAARCGLGRPLACGDVLWCHEDATRPGWPALATRRLANPVYPADIELAFWRGPQWRQFSPAAQEEFCATNWIVSACSDRMGVRLDGAALAVPPGVMLSEPVRAGSVQVTGGGQPLVTMRDGPTVGGYPKIAWLDDEASRRLAQVAPGGRVRFGRMHP